MGAETVNRLLIQTWLARIKKIGHVDSNSQIKCHLPYLETRNPKQGYQWPQTLKKKERENSPTWVWVVDGGLEFDLYDWGEGRVVGLMVGH